MWGNSLVLLNIIFLGLYFELNPGFVCYAKNLLTFPEWVTDWCLTPNYLFLWITPFKVPVAKTLGLILSSLSWCSVIFSLIYSTTWCNSELGTVLSFKRILFLIYTGKSLFAMESAWELSISSTSNFSLSEMELCALLLTFSSHTWSCRLWLMVMKGAISSLWS